jgi:tRNA(Arg) A34 adenosine deaminase TadA
MCLAAIYWARLDALYFAGSQTDAAEAGFNDRFLYEELSKDWKNRTLKTEQHLQSNAQAVFKAWIAKPDKTEY